MLDEYLLGGELQDSSKKTVINAVNQMDLLQEVGGGGLERLGGGRGRVEKVEG